MMEAIEALKTRRSVRMYENKPVTNALLETIVDCGRLAASARNVQPWEFVVVTNADVQKKIADMAPHGRFIADAAACIAVVCKDSEYYLEDGSAATQNMLLAAHALGLGSCWVAGDRKPYAGAVQTLLNLPAGYKLISLVVVGYAAQIPAPAKRSLNEVIHWETF
jgi:nitroreductase